MKRQLHTSRRACCRTVTFNRHINDIKTRTQLLNVHLKKQQLDCV